MHPPFVSGRRSPAHAGVSTEAKGIRQSPVGVPGGSGRALARIAHSHTLDPRKGGIRSMAKKAAKGGKKKAAKKR